MPGNSTLELEQDSRSPLVGNLTFCSFERGRTCYRGDILAGCNPPFLPGGGDLTEDIPAFNQCLCYFDSLTRLSFPPGKQPSLSQASSISFTPCVSSGSVGLGINWSSELRPWQQNEKCSHLESEKLIYSGNFPGVIWESVRKWVGKTF